MLMNRMATVILALGMAAGPAGVVLAAGPAAPSSTSVNATPSHSAPVMPIARHEGTDLQGDRMTRALNLLEANGYGDFSNFQQSGNDFTARVTRNGKPFTLLVNPDTNQITRQG
jgi:hypothetical protein